MTIEFMLVKSAKNPLGTPQKAETFEDFALHCPKCTERKEERCERRPRNLRPYEGQQKERCKRLAA